MERKLEIPVIGMFTYSQEFKSYEHHLSPIHWSISTEADIGENIKIAEKLFTNLEAFNQKAKQKIAEELIDLKNEHWFEYDENDENLDWNAVDAGVYDTSIVEFAEAITLLDIEINQNGIYCEYEDGELFGGHRIHAHFDKKGVFLKADI
ncbi:DUF2262 domain-containing protein [Cytobacillus gottheilii]|uniref:DUF2262 domain-containing protein n=1 Tax=Cytobacillus gottheilii TaxID=859144 RepID=A0ABX8FEB1_9BACI|nr:DUF2262 domain-containing protein [Cytobacillus gottheilii]QVY62351.1 DUF2262 domain-containing protein [Cytobacillus gottheilii]